MFFDAAQMGGAGPRYVAKREGVYRTTTWTESLAAVEEIAAGLIALGLEPGRRVAILSATRPEWMEADLAALAIGCATIPIHPSSPVSECAYLLADSGARTVFVENRRHAEKVAAAVRDGVEAEGRRLTPVADVVIVFDGHAPGCLTMQEVRRRGRDSIGSARDEIHRRTGALVREDLATIVYTAGTTGLPKGVVQTHGNHLSALEAIASLEIALRGEVDFEFLPLAHSFGRMLEYLGIFMGTVTAYAERTDTLMHDMRKTRPHLVPAVPSIFEKIHASLHERLGRQGAASRAVFDWALSVGGQRADLANRGAAIPTWLQALDAVAQRLVFDGIHQRLGGRVRLLVSGAAPLDPQIIRFFHAVGLPLLEGYGLTETTPILTINRPGATRIGTVGQAFPGVTLKIADDGEILAKGPNLAMGYFNRPAETAEAWDAEGWFHTGDIGELDADGYLTITDRKKELIKTAGGRYVAPRKIENLLRARRFVSRAVVIGDRLEHCLALITLDLDEVAALAREHGLTPGSPAELAGLAIVRAAIERQVEEVNGALAPYESIRGFRILARDFSIDEGELTASLELRRKVIATRYQAEIRSMVEAGAEAPATAH